VAQNFEIQRGRVAAAAPRGAPVPSRPVAATGAGVISVADISGWVLGVSGRALALVGAGEDKGAERQRAGARLIERALNGSVAIDLGAGHVRRGAWTRC
jgi:hypothetical protein